MNSKKVMNIELMNDLVFLIFDQWSSGTTVDKYIFLFLKSGIMVHNLLF